MAPAMPSPPRPANALPDPLDQGLSVEGCRIGSSKHRSPRGRALGVPWGGRARLGGKGDISAHGAPVLQCSMFSFFENIRVAPGVSGVVPREQGKGAFQSAPCTIQPSPSQETTDKQVQFTVNRRAASIERPPTPCWSTRLRASCAHWRHVSCDTSQCGACTVHVNGRRQSCMLARYGPRGPGDHHRRAWPRPTAPCTPAGGVQRCHGLQCGFCTPAW